MCAGPAVPLLYDFLRTKVYPEMEKILEKEGTHFNEIDSKMIIKAGMDRKDPLCLKVIEKFTEIYAVEVGNLALKTLPYGGIYLIGGVSVGISDFLIRDPTFLKNFTMKGRLSPTMEKFPIYLVKPHVHVGLAGAEE